MALTVTHPKVSLIADDPVASAAGEVLPSDWNDAHSVSGNLPVSQLDSGTNASSSTFWRGDGTWDAPPSGSVAIGNPVTSGTSGSVLFVDGSGDLAQNNAEFTWDNTNFALEIGATPALYRVPNGSGDNWFEGGAGNYTLTGYSNFGTGDGTLVGLTTGYQNTAIGSGSSVNVTSGQNNLAFGASTLRSVTTQSGNTAIGTNALQSAVAAGNVAIGANSVLANVTGDSNVAIGSNALSGSVTASGNVAIGNLVGANLTDTNTGGTASANVFIGNRVASSAAGSNFNNTVIGPSTLALASGVNYCTVVGAWTGPNGSGISNVIALTDGNTGQFGPYAQPALDWNYIKANVWSFKRTTSAQGLHVYNTFDDLATTVDYERGVFDWTITANVLTIGTQKGGTGATRNIKFIVAGTNELDYGVTNAGNWTFAAPPIVPAYTVGALPTGVTGAQAHVTDGDAGLAWGTTAINSGAGATKYLVWYNGANWTVVGK